MMIQGVSIGDMLNQSMTVLTKPSVQSFEQFERRGGQREALTYVIAAAVLVGVVGAVFGLLGGVLGAVGGLLRGVFALLGFYVFAWVLNYVGKSQGGTGTQDEVFYTAALYTAPLLAITGVVSSIPIIGCLALPVTFALGIYQIYLGYLAARSSMNLAQNPAIITVIAAIVAQFIVGVFIGGAVIAALVAGAAASGALNTAP
ncbi:MAG TPA: Yip1 family protein [Roseiflexaceae bacterium]|nr:Yip1 family protein [Roseiflexaceae bacterium]